MLWLGIESSCDDTSVALVRDGRELLASLTASQVDIHKIYGGVVPEIAGRKHLENINPVLAQVLEKGKVTFKDIDAVAVSNGPGLIGSLLVGVAAAKAVSALLEIPLLGVNHLDAHVYANFLHAPEIELPAIVLLVSGGHTCILQMNSHEDIELLGETRDDAAGECFDKAARIMGLPYPGGPVMDSLAESGDENLIKFPKPFWNDEGYEFSFSGLKTSIMQYCKKHPDYNINDVSASFRKAVVEVLVRKCFKAVKDRGMKTVLIAGGVACNSKLRRRMREEADARGVKFYLPPPSLCTDNAAMVATCAHYAYRSGKISNLHMDAYPV